jgi:hypothetical protein
MVEERPPEEESVLQKAARLGCVHPHFLSFAGRCEGCRKTPLSPNLPDQHNPRRPYPR